MSWPHLHAVYDADGRNTGVRDPVIIVPTFTYDDDGNLEEIFSGEDEQAFFTPDEDGMYYLVVGNFHSSHTGTYTVRVTEIEDDFPATVATTGTVEVGGTATGELQYETDRDWFAVELTAGETYKVELLGGRGKGGTLQDPYIRGIHDANGRLIADTTDYASGPHSNSEVLFTPDEDGTYYIAAGSFMSGIRDEDVGTYTLQVSIDDFRDDTDTTGTVEVGGSVTGEIEAQGDEDWFAVTLEAGKTYQIDMEGSETDGGTLENPFLYTMRDADGNYLRLASGSQNVFTSDQDSGEGLNSRVTFTPDEDGTYYLVAASGGHILAADSHGRSLGTYTLSVADTSPLETSQEQVQQQPVEVDPPVAQTVSEPAGEDFSTDPSTSGRVAVGDTATGRIGSSGDQDWFAVELVAGRIYVIDLRGSPTGDGTLRDPLLHGIHDADGNRISGTLNDDGGHGYNSRVTFTATESGIHYIAAGAYSGQGTYELEVTDTSPPIEEQDPDSEGPPDSQEPDQSTPQTVSEPAGEDFAANTSTSGRVAVGSSAIGEIENAGDQDWFAVELEAGKTYRIDMSGVPTGGGTLPRGNLHGVYDAEGNRIPGLFDPPINWFTVNYYSARQDDDQVFFTPEEDGTYYVAASNGVTTDTGTYTVRVTEMEDDFLAAADTTGTVEVGGSATGEIEYEIDGRIGNSGDRDWFAVELVAGRTYVIDLRGSPTGDGTLSDPLLHGIHDADGNRISNTTDDNGGHGYNSRVSFTATESGTHYIAVGAYYYGLGTYEVEVTDTSPPIEGQDPDSEDPTDSQEPDQSTPQTVSEPSGEDFPTNPSTSGQVAVGDTATGRIGSMGDGDWFAVELGAGREYRIDLKGSPTGDGTLIDPYFRGVYDEDGNIIPGTVDDDGGEGRNSRVIFTVDADGTYYLDAGAFSIRTGTYTLSVEEVVDGI